METLEGIRERQRTSSGRDITLRCGRCRLNLLTYIVDGSMSYLSYVRDCVDGHPDSRGDKQDGR